MFGIYQLRWLPIIAWLWAAWDAIHRVACPICRIAKELYG